MWMIAMILVAPWILVGALTLLLLVYGLLKFLVTLGVGTSPVAVASAKAQPALTLSPAASLGIGSHALIGH